MSENKFGFRIVNIDIFRKLVEPKPSDLNELNFTFDIATESGVLKEQELVLSFVKTDIREGNNLQIFATFTIVCIFQILSFADNVTLSKDGLYILNEELEKYLKSVAISTSRGVIWSELRGTYLHNAVMPVIDISTLKKTNEMQFFNEKGEFIK